MSILAALMAGVLAIPTGVPAAATPPAPRIDWGSCGSDPALVKFQCATVEVPTDYDRPNGRTTTIALTRLPAGDSANRIGTLFTNPGGPGGSGVQFVQQAAEVAYTPEVRARFDILGFDPRGVGGSDPATCFRTAAEEAEFWAGQPAFPLGRAQERATTLANLRLALSCASTSPDRFAHMSTANVARDMDLLRQAVGDDKLTYIGYSYGTYLGATYAKLFPHRVRALVLDGTLLPAWYSGSDGDRRPLGTRIRQGEGADETLREFNRLCKRAGPARCALAALGDPATVVESTLRRLKTRPAVLTLPDGTRVTVTYQDAVANTFLALYEPAGYPDLAAFLAALASSSGAGLRSTQVPAGLLRRGEDYPGIGTALQPCIESRHTNRPLSYPAYADDADERAPHFGRFRTWAGQMCEFLPIRDRDAYLGPWQQKVREPVLVFGTRFDPATPYRATRPYAELFPDARMVTVNGWGHTTIGKSRCADDLITRYLVTRRAPADGSSCGQDRGPFDPAAARARSDGPMPGPWYGG